MQRILVHFHSLPNALLRNKPGAYVLKHLKSGVSYVGSSSDLLKRMFVHKNRFARKAHENKALQTAYDCDPNFDLTITFSADRESAYDIEQGLIDEMLASGKKLFNVSTDVRLSGKGHVVTPEHRAILVQVNTGKKASLEKIENQRKATQLVMSDPEVIAKLRAKALEQWKDPTAHAKLKKRMQKQAEKVSRAISVDGQQYLNTKVASEALNMSKETIRHRCKSNNPKFKDWVYL